MRARASKDGLTLRVIAGSNNILLAMDLQEVKRKGCLGFTIERTDIETGEQRWLPNLLRFEGDEIEQKDGGAKEGKADAVPSVSSARAPLQTFRWGDYTVEPGKRYRYRVVARYGSAAEIVRLGKDVERRPAFDTIPGGVSVEIKTENNRAQDAAVFFNRGAAASKAYNDRFGDNDPQKIPEAMRWLSRGLEEAVTSFIGHAADADFALHAAIYEFQKPELLQALKQAKARGAEVKVTYHGRVKPGKDGPDPKDKTAAKNNDAIKKAGIDFAKPRQANPQGAIMHNKFMVLLKKAGGALQPIAVWTGSTNWTEGGIYGQLNVGHAVYDGGVAGKYEEYFELLYSDASADTMKKQTDVLTPVPKNRDAIRHGVTPIFSPQHTLAMIDLYAELCNGAKVLMVCAPFELHETILDTFKKMPPDVVRFLMADKEGAFGKKGEITLLQNELGNEVTVATVLQSPLHDFQGGLLEDKESFHHVGVHVHSKIIAADPFGTDPILVTGSANFSNNSTRVNDSNSLIIRGDTATMDVYVTEFMRMFEHYWFRAHMQGKTKGGAKKKTEKERRMGLVGDSSWTDPFYKPGNREMLERLAFAGLGS
jgi:phosphatidylserine/phosphatidylglycerophosphate/cardiolipin synthase-like enzyme